MQLLILGGGVFLGAAVMDAALASGHQVTVFNRGLSRSHWPDGVEVLVGDRISDLSALHRHRSGARRRWDAVIDTCGYLPREVCASAGALDDCGRYLFVSSVSAYASFGHAPILESDPLINPDGVDPDDRSAEAYGAQKAACEAELVRVMDRRALIVRPGLIVGPGDPTGRFSHWPWRVAAGAEFLAPAVDGGNPLQFIDVRDLAQWMVRLVELGEQGAFNATGPVDGSECGWATLLAVCVEQARNRGLDASPWVQVDESFLLAQGVQPWVELPLWLPSTDASLAGFMRVDLTRAFAHGLRTRPLAETVGAILDEGVPARDDRRRVGKLDPQREEELLSLWRRAASPVHGKCRFH